MMINRKNKLAQTVIEIICFLFILLLVYAAVSKLLNYTKFRIQLGQSPILNWSSGLLAWLLPAIEIVLSLLLCYRKYRLTTTYLVFSLMLLFTGYIIIITRFSDYTPCSCGGVLQSLTWNQHLLLNIFFTALAIISVVLQTSVNQIKKQP